MVAGVVYGTRIAPPGTDATSLVLLSVAGVLLFVWVQGLFHPVLRRLVLGPEERGAGIFDFVWEGAVGAVVVLGAARVLEAPLVPSAGMATAVGGFMAWGLAGLAGGGVAGGASTLLGWRGSSTPRAPDHSAARARAVRGDLHGALEILEAAIDRDPGDLLPYRTAARILEEAGRIEDAVRWLRRARRDARLRPEEEVRAARRSAELLMHRLERPARAAPELAWIVEHAGHGPDRAWAERELRRVKAEIPR